MERTHGQLGTGLADGLGRDNADGLAGVIYLAFRLIQGTLSPTATAIVIGLAALAGFFMFVNKVKQSNQ